MSNGIGSKWVHNLSRGLSLLMLALVPLAAIAMFGGDLLSSARGENGALAGSVDLVSGKNLASASNYAAPVSSDSENEEGAQVGLSVWEDTSLRRSQRYPVNTKPKVSGKTKPKPKPPLSKKTK